MRAIRQRHHAARERVVALQQSHRLVCEATPQEIGRTAGVEGNRYDEAQPFMAHALFLIRGGVELDGDIFETAGAQPDFLREQDA